MLGVRQGSMYCTRTSSTAVGSGLSSTLHTASTETAMPERMNVEPKTIAPPPKKRSSSSCPALGMRESGSAGPRLASSARDSAAWTSSLQVQPLAAPEAGYAAPSGASN